MNVWERKIPFIFLRNPILLFAPIIVIIGIWPGDREAVALHEIDHRFTVQGRVCGDKGDGLEGVKVIVKDTRASIGESDVTDGDGAYKVILHLHDENQGDPLTVKALEFQEQAQVEFDPNDKSSERTITINLGGKCVPSTASLPWVYWVGVAGGLLGLGVAIKMFYKKPRKAGSSKTKSKSR